MRKLLYFISILIISLTAGGCATIMTMTTPPVEEISLGQKGVGEQISINYKYIDGEPLGTLMMQPYCMETAEQEIMTRRRMHGVVPALVEIPLYGLGLLDLVGAGVYAKASEETRAGDYVRTGNIIECGDFEPASETTLYVQCSETGQMKSLATDISGKVDTDSLYKGFYGGCQINLFVKEEGGFAYITTLTIE